MLKNLQIKNYALIKELALAPSSGLSTITGETGAGKSIMLGALGLLLGNRADTKSLLNPEEKCVVEGLFDIEAYRLKDLFYSYDLDYFQECILRREISPSGKSRAFINDTPVTLDVVKDIGSYLIDVHSQTDTLLLGKSGFQLRLIDSFADALGLVEDYRVAYREFRKIQKQLDELKSQASHLKKESDYHQFLFDELEKAALKEDEQQELEEEQKLLDNAEEIKRKLLESTSAISGNELSIIEGVRTISRNLSQISEFSENYKLLHQRIESVLIELKDIGHELEGEDIRIEFDQGKQEEVNERLSLIYSLQKKHDVESIEELLKIKDSLEEKLHVVSNIDDDLIKKEKEYEAKSERVNQIAEELSEKRKTMLSQLKEKLQYLLADLGMPHATIDFQIEETAPGPSGIDEIDILFSANRGIRPEQLKKVASGGEFSRLMFAIKNIIAEKTALPTIIFDEIDTGISGEIALKMASLMRKMANHHQVIAITHLPQIASKGDQHFFVYKDNTEPQSVSRIKKLENDDRIMEIAKMIGGDTPSDSSLNSARELLAS